MKHKSHVIIFALLFLLLAGCAEKNSSKGDMSKHQYVANKNNIDNHQINTGTALMDKQDSTLGKSIRPKFITPTKLEAIKAFNSAFQYYNDSYGLVPDDVAKQRMDESKKKIIESFPDNWKCGLLVVRYVDSGGDFGCSYYPLIETQDGYYYGDYYLKGVEIKEVIYDNIYQDNLSPVCTAEKNPIVIWRSSCLWKESKIWDSNYWKYHGHYRDPDIPGAEWLPLN